METFEGTVRDLSARGMGVVDHPSGQVFFVPGTWPGDRGRFAVFSVKKRYGFADLVELLEPSPDRVEPPCPYQGVVRGRCGGCPWMIADYSSQLRVKQHLVEHLLTRSKVLDERSRVLPIWGSPQVFGYRNRAQFKTDGQQLGFVSRDSRRLVEVEDCLVLTDQNRQRLKDLRRQLPNPAWRANQGYQWSFLEINEDIDVSKVVPNTRLPFKQGNSAQNQKMREWVLAKLQKYPREYQLVELFAGSGNFTEVLVKCGFSSIVATEVVPSAVEELTNNNWPGVTALELNIYLPSAWNKLKKVAKEARVLLLDPPREGFKEIDRFLNEFRQLKAIYYISCEVAQFAQDAGVLKRAGWDLVEVQPLDQFPHTPYVELLAEFHRVGPDPDRS
ncbi:MAG: class I SAM-dependent RNA methyltransferase [Bdellovibrionales bacterium]|nr:class I SAM-dependent RNA methyltransferase [Bdellovibrionales bacterium]